MKVYSPSDIAELLNIKLPTLRKYSIMLEERGYNIARNSQNHRYYQDKDIITLRKVITASKSGITLDEAIRNIVSIEQHNSYTNDIDNADTPNNSDIKELKELVYKQNELIKGLAARLDEQQQYIDKRLEERDRLLMQTMKETLEAKKQIASTEAAEEKEENKKGFWSKLFS